MKTTKPLNYVFKLSVLSCSGKGEWIFRSSVVISNQCKSTPAELAGEIAAHHLKPGEQGVKVEFIGLQEDKSFSSPVTSIGNLALILLRVPETLS